MDLKKLLSKIELAYNIKLPERYKKFILENEYKKYSEEVEFTGYIRGPYTLDFIDENLDDVMKLGEHQGIYDMEDGWEAPFHTYIPFASYSHPEVDEPKGFLVWDKSSDQMPILLYDYDGPRVYAVADSLDLFLKNFPTLHNDLKKSRNASQLEKEKFVFWRKS